MKQFALFFITLFSFSNTLIAQTTTPDLIGYWHNWNDPNAPSIPLNQVDSRYTIVDIAFAVPEVGTDYKMAFIPDQFSSATFLSHVQALQSQGKKVIISIGGAATHVSLDNISERDTFISTMGNILTTYGFDGIDIDLEGSSVSVTGGTIATPVDAKIINLIEAIKQIMSNYYTTYNKRLLLTMAPETAFVQGGMSAYGGIWGAYLPIIHALRDSIEILHVQLYNSGSMYGIDGNIYTQGTSDFIVAMTEAVIQGFNTSGGMFMGLPANKVVIGLPACPSAAGGGYTDTTSVINAVQYLRGVGNIPGIYTLQQIGGYASLRGMMTWSINWDAVSTCATTYEYANTFESIFNTTSSALELNTAVFIDVFPNPSHEYLTIKTNTNQCTIKITNLLGEILQDPILFDQSITIQTNSLNSGFYFITITAQNIFVVKKIIVN